MQSFKVALDRYGSYERAVSSVDANRAAEEWAAWYCSHTTEYDLSECYVQEGGGAWVEFSIEIDSRPIFNAARV